MVQFFQQNPDPGTQHAQAIAQGFGGGFGQGIKQGLSAQLSGLLSKKKEVGKVRTNLNSLIKRYGKDAFDPETINAFETRAKQLLDEGLVESADDATMMAIQERIQKNLQESAPQQKQQNDLSPSLFTPKEKASELRQTDLNKALGSLKATGENLYGASAQALNPLIGHLETLNKLQDLSQAPQRYLVSKLKGESNADFFKKEGQRFNKKLDLQDAWTEITEGRNLPKNTPDRLIQAWIGGGTGGVAVQVYNEAKQSLGFETPEWLRPVEDAFIFVAAIKNAKKFDLRNSAANRFVVKQAQKIADKINQPVESVIQQAANDGNINLQKAAVGDVSEINKLNGRISLEARGAEKVKSTEKTVFNPKQAIKEHEAHGKKLEASPFRENFEIENKKAEIEAKKTPETRKKEAELAERVQPKIMELEKKIDANQKELANLENYAKKYTGAGKERLDLNISSKRKAIEKQMEELKDLRYELKYGRPRPTEAQLEIDAQNAAKRIVEQVRNPTSENTKAFEDQLAKDQRFLDRAESTRKRGEFNKDFQPDEHIRIMEKYQKAYDAMIIQLKDEISSLKGARDSESLKRISENKEAIKRLEQRQKRHKANITNQKEKIIALNSIQGASGALYKNQIRRAQSDLAEFQKDFAQFKKSAETKSEIGTSHKGQEAIKESGKEFEKAKKLGEDVGKNPTQENIQTAAKETGQKPEEVKQEAKKLGDDMAAHAKKVKEGKASEKDINHTETFIKEYLNPLKNAKAAVLHFGVGMLTGVIENEFGFHIRRDYLYGAASLAGMPTRQIGRGLGFSTGHTFVNYIYEKAEGNKLKELRKNPNEYTKYLQSLRKRYGPKRINQMIEYSKD
jgi:hypothetical protein